MTTMISTRSALQTVTSYLRRLGRVPLLLIFLWLATLWWGEHSVFERSVSQCQWHLWESWPSAASPHHVLLVADPQLVDPHTYPGRPWPLSTLTVLYTDLYMRRSYRHLLRLVQPDTTLFLGDLFDGGREWSTSNYHSPQNQYIKYGMGFWLKEYRRFMTMFVTQWQHAGLNSLPTPATGGGRRLIASLPGNHDLGFAGGIDPQVKSRFDAHFGPLNRVDVIGNHSFVSLDTVSLSAMDAIDPVTGSSGNGDGTAASDKNSHIWRPVENFLVEAKDLRSRAVAQHIRNIESVSGGDILFARPKKFPAEVVDIQTLERDHAGQAVGKQESSVVEGSTQISSSHFPTIVLSHVPLFRGSQTNCGPQRERGTAIPLGAGYQYQNVLTPLISKDIVDHLDASQITMIYSGDDHDYCEIDHDEFSGRIKEITVKSMSWAMGVQWPGVQLASLWNPIDFGSSHTVNSDETPSSQQQQQQNHRSTPRGTVQNKLCLLPNQLGIFIRYGQVLGLTVLVLLIRALRYDSSLAQTNSNFQPTWGDEKGGVGNEPLLPITIPPRGSETGPGYRPKQTPPSSPRLHSQSFPDQTYHNHGTGNGRNDNTTTSRGTKSGSNPMSGGRSGLGRYGNLPPSSRSVSPPSSSTRNVNTDVNTTDSFTTVPRLSVEDGTETDDWGMPLSPSKSFASYQHQHPQPHPQFRSHGHSNGRSGRGGLFFISYLTSRSQTRTSELGRSLVCVSIPVLVFYSWMLWQG